MKKLSKKQQLIILTSVITIIVIIGIIIGANIIRTNIANGNYNSSNGSSNNNNLIPEYIKKGITLGGVTGTLEDLDTSDATAKPEDVAWGKTCYVKGEKITGTRRTLDMLSIGDYVEYTPDTTSNYSILSTYSGYSSEQSIPQEKLNWQILSINNDGTVELISENRTTKYIALKGALGYNNGVYLLNDIGKQLYSNKTLGAIGRSINIEDIEKNYSELGKTYKNNNTGNVKTVSSCNYPVLYAQENGSGINTTVTKTDGINGSYNSNLMLEKSSYASSLTATYTFYKIPRSSEYYDNGKFLDLIKSSYWIATRCVDFESETIHFGLMGPTKNNTLFNSTNYNSSEPMTQTFFRPVVTLPSSIKVTGGEGTSESPYQITN